MKGDVVSVKRDRVRLYHQIRSAHLERAAQLPAATILYGEKRYDFHDEQTAGLELLPARGWRATVFLMRNAVGVLEVNEPLMLVAARSTALALAGLALRQLLGSPRTRVVSYAIENLDPRSVRRPAGTRRQLGRRLDLYLAHRIWRRLDRIAFGTTAARDLYGSVLPQSGKVPASAVIPALPAAAVGVNPSAKDRNRVLFLGAFVERKGLPLLLSSWPLVAAELPEARLTAVGKGALLDRAVTAAADNPTIDLVIDPAREQIRTLLSSSQVLVLPSQPQPSWREQVGLPIVEGLSFGCTIVTTAQTGLASWLTEHGHYVILAGGSAAELAAALVAALQRPLEVAAVVASLPACDGRLAADKWLFDPDAQPPQQGPRSDASAGMRV